MRSMQLQAMSIPLCDQSVRLCIGAPFASQGVFPIDVTQIMRKLRREEDCEGFLCDDFHDPFSNLKEFRVHLAIWKLSGYQAFPL